MVSMSSTPSTVKNGKPAPMQLKKRTADQAGLDHATADALGKKMAGDMNTGDDKGIAASDSTGKDSARDGKDISAKDWLLDQVAKMEAAFKDACYYRALIIRFHVEARYHNVHYVQPQAPRYMIERYRNACQTWESTKSTVQAYLEEAAKRYVPPAAPIDKQVKPLAQAPPTSGVSLSANETSQAKTGATKSDASLPYIDPRTGLPSPSQPTIKIDDIPVEVKPAEAVLNTKSPRNGKLSFAATKKKSSTPVALDSGRKKAASTPTPVTQSTSANSSINAKFPTGSAGDPIEIDDLDIDMDNDADIMPLTEPPNGTGKGAQPLVKPIAPRGTLMGAPMTTQPEGIGLGLGIGEINVDLPVTGPQGASDPLLDPPTQDLAGDVSTLLQNIQNAVAATAGEAQLSEEDIMKFFETLAPGAGDGGDGGQGGSETLLAGDNGQFTGAGGLGMTDQFAGNNQDQAANALDQAFMASTGDINDATNALKDVEPYGDFSTQTGEAAAAAPAEAGENGIPEELDLSNMDWTQYSALLADVPDDNGTGA